MAPLHATSFPLPASAPPAGRVCAPEILDTLPADTPAAQHCRRDLQLINAAMGNPAWLERVLLRRVRAGERVLELGAGAGELGARLHARGLDIEGLDRAPRPARWPAGAAWHQADILQFTGWSAAPVVLANLILHHFTASELRRFGAEISAHARLLVAVEPHRSRASRRLFLLLARLIRAHPVTRHDGAVSINAGFRGNELPDALGLSPRTWRWRVQTTWRGAYRLVAERKT